jgi:hypothetical protein
MAGIGAAAGLPAWWRWAEGPSFAATGAVVLALMTQAGDPTPD